MALFLLINRDAQTCKTQLLEALQITHAKWDQNGGMYLCNQEIRNAITYCINDRRKFNG